MENGKTHVCAVRRKFPPSTTISTNLKIVDQLKFQTCKTQSFQDFFYNHFYFDKAMFPNLFPQEDI